MYSVRDVVHDLIEARGLLDEAYADDEISDGLVGWPPTLEPAVECWLTAYTAYYNHHRSHQALAHQTPITALKQEGSI